MDKNKMTKTQACGVRCRQIRQAKGMSQQELAEKMHVTAAAVSKWEKEGITNYDTIIEISNVLGQDITADQIDQEGRVGEVGKEILSILVCAEGRADFKNVVNKLYGMEPDRVANELFKLERIGTVIREQYRDYFGNERDVIFITAKGVVVFKNTKAKLKKKEKTALHGIKTLDELLSNKYASYQDMIDNDLVMKGLMKLSNESLSFRCDYIAYLFENFFDTHGTGNRPYDYMFFNSMTRSLYLSGESCYIDILRRMIQRTNRIEIDRAIVSSFTMEEDYEESINKYVNEATGMEDIEIDAVKKFGADCFLYCVDDFDVPSEHKNLFQEMEDYNILEYVEGYKASSGIDVIEMENEEKNMPFLPKRVYEFFINLEDGKAFNSPKWFNEDEIKAFINENILPPLNEAEEKTDQILHEIWAANPDTIKYYYSFPKRWENNGLAQLIRDKVGVPPISSL